MKKLRAIVSIAFMCSIHYILVGNVFAEVVKSTPVQIMQEDTDLKEVEHIAEELYNDITSNIALSSLQRAIVFIPTAKHITSAMPVSTVFDDVFTQSITQVFVKHGIPVVASDNRKKVMLEYEKVLKKRIEEKKVLEQEKRNKIIVLEKAIAQEDKKAMGIEPAYMQAQNKEREIQNDIRNTENARLALMQKQEENERKYNELQMQVRVLENSIETIHQEIARLRKAERDTIVDIENARNVKDKVELILGTTGTPITEVNSIEASKRRDYVRQSDTIIEDKQKKLVEIRGAIRQKEAGIVENEAKLSQSKVALHSVQLRREEDTKTIRVAIEQSDARLRQLAQRQSIAVQVLKQQETEIQNIQNKKLLLQGDIAVLQSSTETNIPVLYDIAITYNVVGSVLFITAKVSSGLYGSVVYLTNKTARITSYTAMLLEQEPLFVRQIQVKSILPPKKAKQAPRAVLEKGIH